MRKYNDFALAYERERSRALAQESAYTFRMARKWRNESAQTETAHEGYFCVESGGREYALEAPLWRHLCRSGAGWVFAMERDPEHKDIVDPDTLSYPLLLHEVDSTLFGLKVLEYTEVLRVRREAYLRSLAEEPPVVVWGRPSDTLPECQIEILEGIGRRFRDGCTIRVRRCT